MSENTTAPDINTLMAKCQPDRVALTAEIEPLFKQLMGEALRAVEAALPDFREPGSTDARMHATLRTTILNKANAQVRELPLILKNYLVQQVYTRQVVMRASVNEVATQWVGVDQAAR